MGVYHSSTGETSNTAMQKAANTRASAFKPDHTPWPARKLDASTTYNTLHNKKSVPAFKTQSYGQMRAKLLDKTDYGTHGQPTYKV